MHRKGSILMISLWILAFLVVFAVGLGHRVSLNLRLARYQKDRLKAYCLAKAGFNKAVSELKNKEPKDYDSLRETWSTGKDADGKLLFDNIEIAPGSQDKFSVRYLCDLEKSLYLCMRDEESLININKASKEALKAWLETYAPQDDVDPLIKNIRIWRGDTGDALAPEAQEYKNFKKFPFAVPEELLIIFEDYYKIKALSDYQQKARDLYSKLKDTLTVYGQDKVNINTVQPEALKILIKAIIAKLADAGTTISQQPEDLMNIIMEYRKNSDFLDINLENIDGISGNSEFIAIVNELKSFIAVGSENFRIVSYGSPSGDSLTYKIEAVYNRKDDLISYWHQD